MKQFPKIIDNKRKIFLEVFKDISENHEYLSIATGYWNLEGMKEVFEHIKHYKKIRLLIGREPLIPRHTLLRPEPDYPDKDFFYDLEQMQPNIELKNLVQSIKKIIEDGNLEVKVYRKNFLHAKCYIFGNYSSENTVGIIGSSNFTKSGLTHNTELNSLESDHRIVTFKPNSSKQEVGHLFWFDQFWNDSDAEDWNGEFTDLLEQSPIGDILFSPYETYIKTLYELYKEELEDEKMDTSIKGQYELQDFQHKNAQALLRRLKKYGIAMLADSVGLGKTITAIEVIKQYLNGEEGLRRVEIICPKSLKPQWKKELSKQGVQNLKPIVLQNPNQLEEQKELDHIASVSLFVIDESHNLKNRAGKRFDQITKWIKNNPKAHVLLLTATPINNSLADISNQILMGSRGEADILKVTVVDKKSKHTNSINFYQAIENLKKKINQDLKRDGSFDSQHVREVMKPILRALVVRRTRQGIEKEYGSLRIEGKEMKFPKVHPEIQTYKFNKNITEKILNIQNDKIDLTKIYKFSAEDITEKTKRLFHPLDQLEDLEEKYTDEELKNSSAIFFVYKIILLLGFIPYRWQMYKTKYHGKTREQVKEITKSNPSESKPLFLQLSIYGILRTMFLKRIESSISAVRASLETYKRKLQIFEEGLKINKIVSLKDLSNIEAQLRIEDEDIEKEEIILDEEDELDTVDDKKYVLDTMKEDIRREKNLIKLLEEQLEILEQDDAKISSFVNLLKELKKDKSAGEKVLVFSFYADTIKYLEKEIPKLFPDINEKNTAFISSKNKGDSDNLANRFSPKARNHSFKDDETELRYLFSTDVLSEGQNLQDCGILINYDLHWNPVRMIQRNGRINRIGTKFDKVFIYNIKPEEKIEEYLRLVQRLEGKIILIRDTIGTDTPVLDEKENPLEFSDQWQQIYSDNLQKRLEAIEKAEEDADFLLSEDDYVSDLKIFNKKESEKYKEKIYNISKGKWAIMPQTDHKGEARPEILVLNTLFDKENLVIGHSFALMKKDGSSFAITTPLQALEWLKTTSQDNQRIADKITVNKTEISESTKERVVEYEGDEEETAPRPQQRQILRLLADQHCDEEDIRAVEKAFNTTNILDSQKISKLTKLIIKAKKENKSFINQINELIQIAKENIKNKKAKIKYAKIEQNLFYTNKNE